MSDEEKQSEPTAVLTEKDGGQIKFILQRSNYYREVFADGAFGNLTPNFDIHISFYNQHYSERKEQLFVLNPDGTLGPEIKADDSGITDVSREVEVGVTLNVGTAISLIRWLTKQVRQAQKAMGEAALQENGDDE